MAELTFLALTKGRGAVLTGVSPAYAYVDGVKTDAQDGVWYHIVLPAKEYFKASVKVADLFPVITNEEIKTAMEVTDTYVEFDDFAAKWYKRGKEWHLSCQASHARLVKQ